MTTNELSIDQQRRAVYDGICAVAAVCDGAISRDYKGFRGQDVLFGHRIAAVPFEGWTEAVHAEAAKLATIYRQQIIARTGVDISTLPIVVAARDNDTNHQARNDARTFERRTKKAAEFRVLRMVIEGHDAVAFSFPFDDEIREAVKAAGCRFNSQFKVWWAPVECYNADLRAAAAKWFTVAPEVAALAATPAPAPQPTYNVGVVKDTMGRRLWIRADYNADRVVEARKLPGRRFNGALKLDEVDTTPAVLAFAERWGLTVSPNVHRALEAIQGPQTAPEAPQAAPVSKADVLAAASAASDPAAVGAAFEALLAEALR